MPIKLWVQIFVPLFHNIFWEIDPNCKFTTLINIIIMFNTKTEIIASNSWFCMFTCIDIKKSFLFLFSYFTHVLPPNILSLLSPLFPSSQTPLVRGPRWQFFHRIMQIRTRVAVERGIALGCFPWTKISTLDMLGSSVRSNWRLGRRRLVCFGK